MYSQQEVAAYGAAVAKLDKKQLTTLIGYLQGFLNRQDKTISIDQFYAGNANALGWLIWVRKAKVMKLKLLLRMARVALANYGQAAPETYVQPTPAQPQVIVIQTPQTPVTAVAAKKNDSSDALWIIVTILILAIAAMMVVNKIDAVAALLPPPFASLAHEIDTAMNQPDPRLAGNANDPVPTTAVPAKAPNQPTQPALIPTPTVDPACQTPECVVTGEINRRGLAQSADKNSVIADYVGRYKAVYPTVRDQTEMLGILTGWLDADTRVNPTSAVVPTATSQPAKVEANGDPVAEPTTRILVFGTPQPSAPTDTQSTPSVTPTPECGVFGLGCTAIGDFLGWNEYPPATPTTVAEAQTSPVPASEPTKTLLPAPPANTVVIPIQTQNPPAPPASPTKSTVNNFSAPVQQPTVKASVAPPQPTVKPNTTATLAPTRAVPTPVPTKTIVVAALTYTHNWNDLLGLYTKAKPYENSYPFIKILFGDPTSYLTRYNGNYDLAYVDLDHDINRFLSDYIYAPATVAARPKTATPTLPAAITGYCLSYYRPWAYMASVIVVATGQTLGYESLYDQSAQPLPLGAWSFVAVDSYMSDTYPRQWKPLDVYPKCAGYEEYLRQ